MDLERTEQELARIAAPVSGRGGCPLENPDVKPITEEFLILPHPDEPGEHRRHREAEREPNRLDTPPLAA